MALLADRHKVRLKVCRRRILETANGDPVMHLIKWRLAALFAGPARSFDNPSPHRTPAESIANASTAPTPSRMVWARDELGLPLRHAAVVAEDVLGMEVACCPGDILSAPIARERDLIPVRCGPASLSLAATFNGTVLPCTALRDNRAAAVRASECDRLSPSVLEVALGGAESLWGSSLIRVTGVEGSPAARTVRRLVSPRHIPNSIGKAGQLGPNIEANEEYAERAVRRLNALTLPAA